MEIYNHIKKYTPSGWSFLFTEEFDNIEDIVSHIQDYIPCYPLVFNIFYQMTPQEVEVVIMLQDPYPEPSDAKGIAMSTNGPKVTQSLKNTYSVLERTVEGFKSPDHGDLRYWCQQGVFLTNVSLTVIPYTKQSGSHLKLWKSFSAKFLQFISKYKDNIVFILLGKPSRDLKPNIANASSHCILEASHPIERGNYSRDPFSSCNVFNQCNEYLISKNKKPIDWQLPPRK